MKMKLSKSVYYKFGDTLSRKGEFWEIGFLKCVERAFNTIAFLPYILYNIFKGSAWWYSCVLPGDAMAAIKGQDQSLFLGRSWKLWWVSRFWLSAEQENEQWCCLDLEGAMCYPSVEEGCYKLALYSTVQLSACCEWILLGSKPTRSGQNLVTGSSSGTLFLGSDLIWYSSLRCGMPPSSSCISCINQCQTSQVACSMSST